MSKPLKVLTTGVFDLFHPGHLSLFHLIKTRWPDCYLIVGVNGDRRTHELKERVLFTAVERAGLIRELSCVDEAVIFEHDTPKELIFMLQPDIFVKGGDWAVEEMPEYGMCRVNGVEVVCMGEKTHNSSDLKRRLASD
jgi:rfaE bifunctional protein nucleotidyltransferase chain/domain